MIDTNVPFGRAATTVPLGEVRTFSGVPVGSMTRHRVAGGDATGADTPAGEGGAGGDIGIVEGTGCGVPGDSPRRISDYAPSLFWRPERMY
jgi:hypothetical protein